MSIPVQTEVQDVPEARVPLTYEQICKIIGHLYLDAHLQNQGLKESSKGVIETLKGQLDLARARIADLERRQPPAAPSPKGTLNELLNDGQS